MAGEQLDNRLWITEFDVENADVTERAEDVADFVRVVFAHPNTESLIMWSWLREVQRSWQPEAFNRALFEENLTFGDDKIESDWPLGPNAAGIAYLNMVKEEWNSTQTIDVADFDGQIRLFKGTYDVNLLDSNGDQIYSREVEVNNNPSSNSQCNQLIPFEFENDEYVTSDDLAIVQCETYSVKGGFTGNNAALITNRQEFYGTIRYLLADDEKNDLFKLKMAVRLTNPVGEHHAKIVKKRGDQFRQVYYQAVSDSEWFLIDIDMEVESEDELFYLTFDDYIGDFMIDRFYFVKLDLWNQCNEQVVDFSSREAQVKPAKGEFSNMNPSFFSFNIIKNS